MRPPEDRTMNANDKKYFRELLRNLTKHPSWMYSETNTRMPEYVITKAVSGSTSNEFFIDNLTTDGRFHFVMPSLDDPDLVVQGGLKQPLDGLQQVDPYPGSFGERIMRAYQSIADEYQAEYLTIDPSPVTLLTFELPFDYEDAEIAASLDTAHSISQEVQTINDAVYGILKEYSSTG